MASRICVDCSISDPPQGHPMFRTEAEWVAHQIKDHGMAPGTLPVPEPAVEPVDLKPIEKRLAAVESFQETLDKRLSALENGKTIQPVSTPSPSRARRT